MIAPIRWQAFEHSHIERGSDWFIALGVTALAIALTSLILGNVFFALLIIAAAVALGLIAYKPPQPVDFEISEYGIRVGDIFHKFDNIISFWVEDGGDRPTLLVDTTKFLTPNLAIPLGSTNPQLVRAFLLEHVNEVPMKESMAHKVLEFIGL